MLPPLFCYCFPEACTEDIVCRINKQSHEKYTVLLSNHPTCLCHVPTPWIQGQVSINTDKFSYCPHNLVQVSQVSFILKIKYSIIYPRFLVAYKLAIPPGTQKLSLFLTMTLWFKKCNVKTSIMFPSLKPEKFVSWNYITIFHPLF